MIKHHEQRLLPFTPQQMFDLVADVEKYPEFLPWCVAVRITHRSLNMFEADVIVGFKMIREKFSTLVKLHSPERIETFYRQGPFKQLHNTWQFKETSEGQCQIDFSIEFELQSKFLQGLLGTLFHEVSHRMVTAFETRAYQIYGKK